MKQEYQTNIIDSINNLLSTTENEDLLYNLFLTELNFTTSLKKLDTEIEIQKIKSEYELKKVYGELGFIEDKEI